MYDATRDALLNWLWADGGAIVGQAAALIVACWVFGYVRRMIEGRTDVDGE